jgi:hypothetical protein
MYILNFTILGARRDLGTVSRSVSIRISKYKYKHKYKHRYKHEHEHIYLRKMGSTHGIL